MTLKNSFSPAGLGALGTLRLTRCLWFAERRCDKKCPPESVLIGVTRPYSFSRLFKKSDRMERKTAHHGQTAVRHPTEKSLIIKRSLLGSGSNIFKLNTASILREQTFQLF